MRLLLHSLCLVYYTFGRLSLQRKRTLPMTTLPYGTLIDSVFGVTTMFGPYLSISLPIWVCMAAETVNVEMITEIARIKPMELIIALDFLRERFFETKVIVRKCCALRTLITVSFKIG